MNVAGIDVGSAKLQVQVRQAVEPQPTQTKELIFENSIKGIGTLLKVLHKHKVRRVVLEATGVYHLDLALALNQAKGVEVMVLNPKAAHHYGGARMQRAKTDRIDAALLAEYAERMPFEPWQAPAPQIVALRACSRRLAALAKQRAQAKNQYHAWAATESTPAFIVADAQLSIQQLEAQIADLQEKTVALIEADASLKKPFELLLSIKGVGVKSAIQLMGELLVLAADLRAKQWVAMAGLDPRPHQSGSSVDKRARISKAGNRYLRTALYMPALSAVRHVAQVRAYYEHLLKTRRLRKIQAICAVMRKLLHAIHGMLNSGKVFDPARFYTPTEAGV